MTEDGITNVGVWQCKDIGVWQSGCYAIIPSIGELNSQPVTVGEMQTRTEIEGEFGTPTD